MGLPSLRLASLSTAKGTKCSAEGAKEQEEAAYALLSFLFLLIFLTLELHTYSPRRLCSHSSGELIFIFYWSEGDGYEIPG